MPIYDFKCSDCKQAYEVTLGMNDDRQRQGLTCVKCGKPLKRIYAKPAIVIKGTLNEVLPHLASNQAIVNCDGRPIKLNFIDHGERSNIQPGSILNSIPGARIDEKTGKPVMDVISNVPDPLGVIERAKKAGKMDTTVKVKRVNQKYKIRK